MADIFGAAGSLVGGLGSFLGGQATAAADDKQAEGYDTAAKYAQLNSTLAGEAGGINQLAAARQIQRTEGTQISTAAGNGLKVAGSAAAIVRDASQQGALQEGVIGLQSAINVTSYVAQAEQYKGAAEAARAAASAAQTSGAFGAIGGILGGVAKLFL